MTDTEITGRDDYITAQALVYAIAHIQSLPEERQDRSNMLDMCELVRATYEAESLACIVATVEHHTEMHIDLHFPEGENQTADDVIYENDYRCEEAVMREMRSAMVKRAVEDFKLRTGLANVSTTQMTSAKAIADAALMRAGATLH